MRPGQARRHIRHLAYELGKGIAAEGWVTLSCGRNVGVMDKVGRDAKENNELTIGVRPGVSIC